MVDLPYLAAEDARPVQKAGDFKWKLVEVGVKLLWNDQTETHRLPIEWKFARAAADAAIVVGPSVFDAFAIEKGR